MSPTHKSNPPNAEEIQALPEHVRRYIHDLETRWHSADMRAIACLRVQVRDLTRALIEARAANKAVADPRRVGERRSSR
jgi:hypothetical protein